MIQTKYYDLRYKFHDGRGLNLKAAHLSDFHETNPEEIISILEIEKPDLILCTGDFFEHNQWAPDRREREKYQSGMKRSKLSLFLYMICHLPWYLQSNIAFPYMLLNEASIIAPVFLSTGNHDPLFLQEDCDFFKRRGIHLLDNKFKILSVKGQMLAIGGLSTRVDLLMLKRFSQIRVPRLLLSHHPEYYDRYIKNIQPSPDLVFTGHAHGGQIRIRHKSIGIYAPGQGWFPQYSHGIYDNCLIVSSGLANTITCPRLHNRKEVGIIYL